MPSSRHAIQVPNSVQYLNPQLSWRNMTGFKMAGMLDSRKPYCWAICRNRLLIIHWQIFWSTPKLWPKIEIQDGGRRPSWIFQNLISVQWNYLGHWFSICVPNLVQKCWSMPTRQNADVDGTFSNSSKFAEKRRRFTTSCRRPKDVVQTDVNLIRRIDVPPTSRSR